MINNNELRRGNYVAHAPTSGGKLPEGLRGAFKVDEIRAASFSATRLGDGLPFSIFYPEAEGIPLTGKFLHSIGFFPFLGNLWEYPNRDGTRIFLIGCEEKIIKLANENREGITFKMEPYLHNLQNIFFALIGDELLINEQWLKTLK